MRLIQTTGFHCPFFMRSIKSHFYHDLLHKNSTDIRDFHLENIRTKLARNPAYFEFETKSMHWNHQQSNSIIVNVVVHNNEAMTSYHLTFWQKCGQMWIHYLSIALIFLYAVDRLKHYMFTRQIIRAWELVPWKKVY